MNTDNDNLDSEIADLQRMRAELSRQRAEALLTEAQRRLPAYRREQAIDALELAQLAPHLSRKWRKTLSTQLRGTAPAPQGRVPRGKPR